jgi:hypothetical protein
MDQQPAAASVFDGFDLLAEAGVRDRPYNFLCKVCKRGGYRQYRIDSETNKPVCKTCHPRTLHYRVFNVSKLLTPARTRAKAGNFEFSLKADELYLPEFCPVLGIELYYNITTGKVHPNSPTIDRRDNSKGHTKDNAFVISYRANALKGDATIEELEKILAYMKRT